MLPERFRRSVPWRVGDLMILYACSAVGLLVIGIAWFGASSSVVVSSQLRWTNVGIGGLIILGAGILAWILAGRRAVGELRRHVTSLIPLPEQSVATEPAPAPASTAAGGRLVSAAGMTHYHRPDCIFVAGKAVKKGTERTFRRQKRTPCAGCLREDEGAP
jgi:hypothetical protein